VGLGQPVPILRSFDEAKTRAFWCDWLGFTVDWEHRFASGMPLYLQIRRGDCVLHVSEHHGDATPGSAVRIAAADLEGLLAELRARPYSSLNPGIEAQPWGTDEIALRDPFGNRVIFWQDRPAD
jgi:catechol 2,3-dioxygenase-like lactoylglutathione lyase family enzyme